VTPCSLVGIYWNLLKCFSLHKDTAPPQPNHTVTPTHIEPEQYNTWSKSTISRKLLKMDVLTFETCWGLNNEMIEQVTSVGLSVFNYQNDAARSDKHKILCVFLVSPKLAAVFFALLPPAAVLTNSKGKSNKGRSFVCSAWNAVCTHTHLLATSPHVLLLFSLFRRASIQPRQCQSLHSGKLSD